MPQIANLVIQADKMIKAAGFSGGLAERKIVVPPGFTDAAFILGAWLAYSHVDMAVPIRTVNVGSGWTMMDFHPEDVPTLWLTPEESLAK